MKRSLLALVILVLFLFCGCVLTPVEPPEQTAPTSPTPESHQPADTPQQTSLPPESYRLEVPQICLRPGNCFLGSFAMLAKYVNPGLELCDVVAYSGVGAYAQCRIISTGALFLSCGLLLNSIVYAARNLDISYIFALGKEGHDSALFEPDALEVIRFNNIDDALNYLKWVISSGHPVEVNLNCYYVYDDFASASDHWRRELGKAHFSHFMVVTGYDKEYVYLNDPLEPINGVVNLPAKIDNFILAWERTDEIMLPEPVARWGPYWMLYPVGVGSQKSVDEILAWNAELGAQAPTEIREFAASPETSGLTWWAIRGLSKNRSEFANFLEKHGKKEAASLYRESSRLLSALPGSSSIKPDLWKIADIEEQALKLLSNIVENNEQQGYDGGNGKGSWFSKQ